MYTKCCEARSEPDYLKTGECIMRCMNCHEIVWRESDDNPNWLEQHNDRYSYGNVITEG